MIALINLEDEFWEPKVGLDINDPIADAYSIVKTPAGLVLIMNCFKAYGGWLAKNISKLLFPSQRITMFYTLMIDDATPVAAQVIETDAKITDEDGWTYDLSAQFNLAKGWMFEIDKFNPEKDDWDWVETGIHVAPLRPLTPTLVKIAYELNYEGKKSSSILSVTVGDLIYDVDPKFHNVPARQVGWAPKEIVTQLQQCNNHMPGGYGLRFDEIGYAFQ